jgi:hypothetical protein
MGEHLPCKQGVVSSILTISTEDKSKCFYRLSQVMKNNEAYVFFENCIACKAKISRVTMQSYHTTIAKKKIEISVRNCISEL